MKSNKTAKPAKGAMSESVKIRMLLRTRIEVIAGYPKSPYHVGQMITIPSDPNRYLLLHSYLKKYPHIFRKLPWYERRDKAHMPLFIKQETKTTLEVCRVHKWITEHKSNPPEVLMFTSTFYPNWYRPVEEWEPATQKEWDEYCKVCDGTDVNNLIIYKKQIQKS